MNEYTGNSGGRKSFGRPRTHDFCAAVSVKVSRAEFDYLKSRGVPVAEYVRELIDADIKASKLDER